MKILVGLLLGAMASFAYSQEQKAEEQGLIPIDTFSRDVQYHSIKLSPNGDYMGVMTKQEGKNVLLLLDTKEFKMHHGVRFPENAQVGDYHWVNNERVVLSKEYLKGWQDHPQYYGELFGVNADGTQGRYLVGYQGEMQTGSRVRKATPLYGTSYVLDPLVHDEDKMLIVTYPWTGSKEPHTIVYEVDVNRGQRRRVMGSPSRMAQFLTDEQGRVRVSVSTDTSSDQQVHIRDLEQGEWVELPLSELDLSDIRLHGFNLEGDIVYASAAKQGEPSGLYKLNLETKEYELVHREGSVSPSKVWVDDVNKSVFAIEYEAQYPTYAFVDSEAKMSQRLKGLLQAIPGRQVRIVSSTQDGNMSVVWAGSDRHPSSYYLYNGKTNKLSFLFSSRSWVDVEKMAETTPIQFKARDGLNLYGYFTAPYGKELKDLPLVVLPHGGPHGPRDWWGFDPDVQLLASRGIAVLQVNFRGSGGFGGNFERAGYRKWGTDIQYDIIDGVKYVIAQGWVDKGNMCIMGGSFGAYSALQSSIIEPDMFKCAVGVVGVYDLPLMFEEGDIAERASGQGYLKKVLGEDETQLKAFSPSYNIDKLKAPVLIVHGGEDERAPIEQAESLIEALKKAKHPYQYVLLEDEGHGFYNESHRLHYYQQVMAFLDQHLKL
ncbi:alpha/beta hydrolase family protein [Pseudoalteromonas sp. T1lg75]|uniref:alpha/beta hydrolase family protein n=1 Tax=Pseudoalteromonas sp. T1lg75 TaxID=2077102 RepID=UPI000CF69AED|nr:S9 family peptidase [Pseudoalteromonas sp. T1lg75]